jgi:hypothetical protein
MGTESSTLDRPNNQEDKDSNVHGQLIQIEITDRDHKKVIFVRTMPSEECRRFLASVISVDPDGNMLFLTSASGKYAGYLFAVVRCDISRIPELAASVA